MSYASISTRNEIGVKKLPGLSGQFRFLSGARGLGDLSGDVTETNLTDAGVDAGVATTLLALGATDDQLNAVIQNPDSEAASLALLAQLSGTGPAPGQPAGTAANFPAPEALRQQSLSQTGYDLTDPASWYDITGQLQQANQRIKTLEALLHTNSAVYAPLIGQDVISLRTKYADAAGKWIEIYTTVIGQQPGGLSGVGVKGRIARLGALGVAPVIIGVAIIAGAAVVVYALHAIVVYLESTEQKAASVQQTAQVQAATATQQQLINAINQATAKGDSATAQKLAQQLASTGYNPKPAGPTMTEWFTANWPWVAGLAAAMVIAPPLIKKL